MPQGSTKNAIILIIFNVALIGAAILAAEYYFGRSRVAAIPFENVLYPYVEFRPPANTTWKSDSPSPSSREGRRPVTYTNKDALRIPRSDYLLDIKKPAGQIRIAMVGGSTVHIGTDFENTLPGALKRNLADRFPQTEIEVINGGIISAISRQELIFLITTIVDYEIDILITYDGINDTGQMLYYEKRPNFPYNYRVMETAWSQYVSERTEPIWRIVLGRSNTLSALWPDVFGDRLILETIPARQLINSIEMRQIFAEAHIDNWEKIRRICKAYDIRPHFVLQPTSLYALFGENDWKNRQIKPLQEALYANYLVYEEFRKSSRNFSVSVQDIGFMDLSSFLDRNAFYDGAHVYDEVNDRIANKLADLVADDVTSLQTEFQTRN